MLKKGTTAIGGVFKGTTEIASIYKGTLLVYEGFKTLIAQGVPPITLQKCANKNLEGYKIYGNSTRSGTPTPSNPIDIESVGDLVTDGQDEHYGKYKIPITVTNSNNQTITTNIYLKAPLRKIGNYADYIDFETQKAIRRIKETTIKAIGFTYYSSSTYGRFEKSVPDKLFTNSYSRNVICEVFKTSTYNLAEDNSIAERHNYNYLRIYSSLYSSASQLNTAVGDKKIYYVLDTATEENITLPSILLNKGSNIIDVDTTITPSNMWIKYKGKE